MFTVVKSKRRANHLNRSKLGTSGLQSGARKWIIIRRQKWLQDFRKEMERQEQQGMIEITEEKIRKFYKGCRIGRHPDQIWFKDTGSNTLRACTSA